MNYSVLKEWQYILQMFFNVGRYLEYRGGYAEILIDSDVDSSVGFNLGSPEGQLPPLFRQEGNIRLLASHV